MGSQRFCLRWNNHQSNLLSVFDQLLHDEAFVDVTLAVEGQFLRAHKMVLSACSPYFQALFVGHPDRHPIVILKDVPYTDMRSLLDFMYRGEVSVDQDRLTAFLKVAESLRIKGLTEVNEERCDLPTIANSLLNQALPPPPPPPNLHRIQQGPPAGLQSPHHMSTMSKRPHNYAPNPMLNSALTAPKRKRGRPRKLSGGSPGTPGMNCDMEGDESKINNVDNHLGGVGVIGEHLVVKPVAPPALPKQLTALNANPPPAMCSPHGDRTFCSPQPDMSPATVPDMRGDASEPQSPVDESLKIEERDDDDGTEAEGDVDEPSPETEHETDEYNHVKMEEDPRPSTSGQENMSPYQLQQQQQAAQQNSAPNGEPQYPPSGVKDEPAEEKESDEESQHSDITAGDYEDMIACSPGSSDVENCPDEVFEDKNGGKTIGNVGKPGGNKPSLPEAENLDDDITQIEQDSFTSLMQQTPRNQSSSVRTRRLDKMSIRRYCTREGNHMYRCNVCSKTYTHISNFCRHFLSAHCGYKQDIHCPVCFKAFTRKDNMMTHAKQVHGVSVAKGPTSEMIEHRSEFT